MGYSTTAEGSSAGTLGSGGRAEPRATTTRPGAESEGNAKDGAGTRVLLVDDERTLLSVLSGILRRGIPGAVIDTCLSASAALENLALVDYDAVITDLGMPALDGLALLERIRALRPDTPTLVLSGTTDAAAPARALRGGAYEFVHKPVEADHFVLLVQRALETRRLRREVDEYQQSLRQRAVELERAVEVRTRELREANRLKDDFLATLSHELRTPLTAILGWARLLNKGRLDPDRRVEALRAIERNGVAQARLVDDLLDVSRIISGQLRIDRQRVAILAVISAALDATAPMARAMSILVESRVDPSLGSVIGDPVRLQQIVWNLLANAIKFTPQGGRVTVGASRHDDHVELRVEDSGVGIEPAFLPHVFERFRQADLPVREARRGLGLGLAIVRHLVELHGGEVRATSEGKGKGSTFIVRLPTPPRDSARTGCSGLFVRLTPPDAADEARRARCLEDVAVLLVDDDEDSRQVLAAELGQAGAEVRAVSSAAEALLAFDVQAPDLLLCDIGLPDEDGYSLLRRVRARPPGAGGNVPAVALTAYAKLEDRHHALAAGFALHIGKPGPADLATRLAELWAARPGVARAGEATLAPSRAGSPEQGRGG